ncbi:hypothetical protein KDH_66370 [Dictyobacter sp. S3.2.2.5]|uniref:HNH nuclease domain-containing protein n=1 Tax=Dictyobacter halimunensis TaxID=3026934 RepID=A0ABQ6G4U5_9CHLR|nr:hypothetical protein KDH_66370 [Dictyobacter sp. S3.2.2.5]
MLQIDLLLYASLTPKGNIGLETCATYLDEYSGTFAGRGKVIADWYFASNASLRNTLLTDFATAFQQKKVSKQVQKFRTDWFERIRKEIDMLLEHDNSGQIIVQSFFVEEKKIQACKKQDAPKWQQRASEFFLYFYKMYAGGDAKLPEEIFSDPKAQPFGRQELLDLFINENKGLEICAICDQARYYTEGQKKKYSILDHYFPKEAYPHFSCHPYNLIPICHTCNSSIKGTKDPLHDEKGKPRPLQKRSLPYRHNLTAQVYLEVSPGVDDQLINIGPLRAKYNVNAEDPALQQAIELLKEIYQLPDLWSKDNQSIRIHDILFRRMRHFLDNGRVLQHGTQVDTEIYNILRYLLYYLAYEDQRRDPFGFALTWMLASYLKEKDVPKSATWRGLRDEINSWFGQSLEKSQERDRRVDDLLNILLQEAKN